MSTYVEILVRRPRGWPWPEDSLGLDSVYGESGWCHECGTPQTGQVGALRLQKRGLTVAGGWVPNWLYDFYCVENPVVETGRGLGLEFRPIHNPKGEDLGASQIIITPSTVPWFDEEELEQIIAPRHGVGSVRCEVCGCRRWMPMKLANLPTPNPQVFVERPLVVSSPEHFGDGRQSMRNILWRRDAADYLLSVGPRDFIVGAEFEV